MKARRRGGSGFVAAAVAVAGLVAACGSGGGGAEGGGSLMGAGATDVTVAQNGTTVHIPVGGTVALVDFPSNWFPRSSDPSVLGDPPVTPGPSACADRAAAATNPPGVPCTQVPLDYAGKKAGTAVLTAHRTQCGEARPCVAPESYDFRLTVVVG